MIGGLIDKLSGSGEDKEKARIAREKALATFEGLETPEYEDINYVAPEYAGDVEAALMSNPDDISVDPIQAALMSASTVGPSEMAGITTDPRLRDAQYNALAGLADISDAGGMTGVDKANMQRMISQVGQQDRGRREAIDQQMARRGMGGSGMDLLAKLSSSQAATDRASQQGLDIQGMAQARALEALMQGGQLGGQMRGQEFGEKSAIAQAQDAIARFNATQTQGANQINTGVLNDTNRFNSTMDFNSQNTNIGNDMAADATNVAATNNLSVGNRDARQGVLNDEAAATNNSLTHNNWNIPNAEFGNDLNKAGGVADGLNGMAEMHQGNADSNRDAFTGAVGGLATIGGGLYTDRDKYKHGGKE